jgi:hypothetical protein
MESPLGARPPSPSLSVTKVTKVAKAGGDRRRNGRGVTG